MWDIRNLKNEGIFNVPSRVSQLKLGHAFKINNKTCPDYLSFHFQRLRENSNRIDTRAKSYNFHVPKISTNTFAYTTIKDWNNLPNEIKSTRCLKPYKEKLVKHLTEKPMNI